MKSERKLYTYYNMKKFLKFSGIIAVGLAVVAMILMMTTPALYYKGTVLGTTVESTVPGTDAIFGNGSFKLGWPALLAWIFILVALVVLIAGIVLPMLKIKVPVAGILNLVAVALLIVAGIFMFLVKGALVDANQGAWGISGAALNEHGMGAGWVIAAILAIAGGVVAVLPAALDFNKKK